MSIDRGMNKEDMVCVYIYIYIYIHIHNGILAIKNEIIAICSNMDGPRHYHTKWSKSEKDKYHIISHTWNIKKKDTNELTCKTEIDSQT